jgi:hypothetical protein
MGRRIRKITVVGVGTPPPLPLRPLVDEVLRALDAKRKAQARSDDGPETGAPGRRTKNPG